VCVLLHAFLTSVLDGGGLLSGQLHASAALPPRESAPGTYWIGIWVGRRASMDAVVKRKIPCAFRDSNAW